MTVLAASDPSLWPAVIGLIGVAVGGVLTWVLGRRGEAVDRRRDGYAAAMTTLVAYTEYPFRIRRRTGDDLDALAALASTGHDLQQELRCHEAWIAAESSRVAAVYGEARRGLATTLGVACNQAWASEPIMTAAGMNLAGWGPDPESVRGHLARFESALACRFGWRRAFSTIGILIKVPRIPAIAEMYTPEVPGQATEE
jgi:hypothetical protein